MIKSVLLITVLSCAVVAQAQGTKQTPTAPTQRATTQQANQSFDLTEFGVRLAPEPRLIIVMAALDAAGFDPTPPGKDISSFRALVRKDQVSLDANLRERLRAFFERNKLPAPATAADQAARYVSLAYALGPPPALDAPERSDDLPTGVLESLDFAPLVREFYRKSGIDERLSSYMQAYQAEGDRLRQPAAKMVSAVLSYLHTRPITTSTQRIKVTSPDKKKNAQTIYSTVEHERRFFIVPDLLAAPGTINFRVIADDYYAIVPEGTDPASSELRRAYIRYVIDALVLRANKEIAAQRDHVKQLIDARTKDGGNVSPDVFVVVTRSLVAAADARFEESVRLANVDALQRARIARAKDDAVRQAIVKEAQSARAAINDQAIARLADGYGNGAPLDFYFADQFGDGSASGFDLSNFFADMIAGFDPTREAKRLGEVASARDRANA